MPQPTLHLHILSLFLMLFHFQVGGFLKTANGQNTWCVAKPTSTTRELIANLDYACGHVDCSLIQEGNSCFYPNTYIHHASFAMNLHYQSMGGNASACDFRDTGLISLSDPSYLSCTYESDVIGEIVQENQILETWCVAKPAAEENLLQANINFACNHVDCGPIQAGGSCYSPTTLLSHATFAMNLYYQNTERTNSSCDFDGSGLVVIKDPSYENCSYEYAS